MLGNVFLFNLNFVLFLLISCSLVAWSFWICCRRYWCQRDVQRSLYWSIFKIWSDNKSSFSCTPTNRSRIVCLICINWGLNFLFDFIPCVFQSLKLIFDPLKSFFSLILSFSYFWIPFLILKKSFDWIYISLSSFQQMNIFICIRFIIISIEFLQIFYLKFHILNLLTLNDKSCFPT